MVAHEPALHLQAMRAQSLRRDALNDYIRHNGSAMFACPPGVGAGGWVGETLFA